MTVLFTGGTGLLGLNTIPHLLDAGHHIKVVARDAAKAKRVLPLSSQITVIQGDLENPEGWLSHLDDSDWVIHAAAYFREYYQRGSHGDSLTRFNVEFPVRLLKECGKRGVKHLVIVSSTGVLGPTSYGTPTDESGKPGPDSLDNLYFRSKVRMEEALAQVSPAPGLKSSMVRPGWMFGPNDHAPTSAGHLSQTLVKTGKLQFVKGTTMSIVDARDVGKGVSLILEKGATGVFNLAGHHMTALEALEAIVRANGKGSIQVIPYGPAMFLSSLLELPTRLLGKENPIPKEGVKTLANGVRVSSAKAERELGVTWRPFEETARDTVEFILRGRGDLFFTVSDARFGSRRLCLMFGSLGYANTDNPAGLSVPPIRI